MKSSRVVFAVVLLAAAIVAAIAWLGSIEPDAAPVDAHRSSSERAPAATPAALAPETREEVAGGSPPSVAATGDSAGAANRRTLLVRSSSGIPLSAAFATGRDGLVRRAPAEHGVVELRDPAEFTTVTAPGFEARPIAASDAEIALAPLADFTISFPGLRAATRTIGIQDWRRPEAQSLADTETHGFIDADTWSIAFDRWSEGPFDSDSLAIEIEFETRHVLRIDEKLGVDDHANVRVDWVAGAVGPPRALDVRITGTRPKGSKVEVTVRSNVPEKDRVQRRMDLSWGTLALYAPVVASSANVVTDAESVRFDALPTGIPFVATALEPDSGAHGRAFFVHDGSEVAISLSPGSLVRGRLVTQSGAPFTKRFDVIASPRVAPKGNRSDEVVWRHEFRGLRAAADGRFEFVLPGRVSTLEAGQFPLPTDFTISVEPALMAARRFPVVLVPGGTVDLGSIVVGESPNVLILAPDVSLDGSSLVGALVAVGAANGSFVGHVRNAVVEDDESTAVELWDRCERAVTGFMPTHEVFPPPSPAWSEVKAPKTLAIDQGNGSWAWFERHDDTRFHRIATAGFRARLKNPLLSGGTTPVTYGIAFRDMMLELWNQPVAADGAVTLEFDAPAEGVSLWWFEPTPADYGRRHASVQLWPGERTVDIPE